MSKHIDLMEPIFFTPPNQATNPVGGRTLYKGGGGGSGQRDATAEERRLWAAQADSLESMNAVAMPTLVTGMGNLGVMANESMDGTLSTRLRNTAGADASQAMGQGLSAASRGLERYGATINPNAMGATMAAAGLEGAKIKSNAMNMANMAAEDVKWQRNAALTGLASGQGSSAVSGMGSLAGQIGQSRASANAADMQQQSANNQAMAGLGMGLAYMMKADGGEVRLADGGGLQKFQRPTRPSNPSRIAVGDGASGEQSGSGLGMVASLALPYAAKKAGEGALAGIQGLGGGSAPLAAGAAPAATAELGTGTGLGFSGLGAGAASAAAPSAVGTGGAGMASGLGLSGTAAGGAGAAAGTAGATAATTGAATGAAAGGAAAGTAAAGTVASTNAWNPVGWAAAAYLAGSALDLWADGGDTSRVDMTPGGPVRGPGTKTSDSIPAWLSNKEFVNNADSVEMPRAETRGLVKAWLKEGGSTKELLNDINNAGLKKRGKPPQPIAETRNGAVRATLGGLAALGHMARGAVPVAMDMDRQNEYTKRLEAQQAEDRRRWDAQNARAVAADQRADEQFGMLKQDRDDAQKRTAGVRGAFESAQADLSSMGGFVDQLRGGQVDPGTFVSTLAPHAQRLGMNIRKAQGGQWLVQDKSGAQSNFRSDAELANYMADPKHSQRRIEAAYLEAARYDPAMADKAMSLIHKNAEAMHRDKEFEAKYGKDGVGGVYGIGGLYDRANEGKYDAALARIEARQSKPVKPEFFATDTFDKDSPQAVQAHQYYIDLVRDLESAGADPSEAERRARQLVRGAMDSIHDAPKDSGFGPALQSRVQAAIRAQAGANRGAPADAAQVGRRATDVRAPAVQKTGDSSQSTETAQERLAREARERYERGEGLRRVGHEAKRIFGLVHPDAKYAPQPGLERVSPAQ